MCEQRAGGVQRCFIVCILEPCSRAHALEFERDRVLIFKNSRSRSLDVAYLHLLAQLLVLKLAYDIVVVIELLVQVVVHVVLVLLRLRQLNRYHSHGLVRVLLQAAKPFKVQRQLGPGAHYLFFLGIGCEPSLD